MWSLKELKLPYFFGLREKLVTKYPEQGLWQKLKSTFILLAHLRPSELQRGS